MALNDFYNDILQEVKEKKELESDFGSQEQIFTSVGVNIIQDDFDLENAVFAYDEVLSTRDEKSSHKINGYSLSSDGETLNLFITNYYDNIRKRSVSESEINDSVRLITNLFRKMIYANDVVTNISETSEIFELYHDINKKLKDAIQRVNVFIFTNGMYTGSNPVQRSINGYPLYYYVYDIQKLYEASSRERMPITIEFGNNEIPCLTVGLDNEDYSAYLFVMPGNKLAEIYKKYGDRLLEKNVRSFLDFSRKKDDVNTGMRNTIKENPTMFFAYNNGLTTTADSIELDNSNRFIKKITNLQIVNGGQTTATIYYTQKKDKIDLTKVSVQVKLSVIKKEDGYDKIVGDISKFANSQNKVSSADLTSNNPKLVTFEILSRQTMTPNGSYWFFDRAKGQYNNKMREGFVNSKVNRLSKIYPKSQKITKELLAKYLNTFEEIKKGSKIVVGPHIVCNGKDKNYLQCIEYVLPTEKKMTIKYYKDSIAKAILFKTAEKRYGSGKQLFKIGTMRNVVVPNTLGLLNYLTSNRINFSKIWNNQELSENLSNIIYSLMKQVHNFIKENSTEDYPSEWAKKEECWLAIKAYKNWKLDLNEIEKDLINPNNNQKNDEDNVIIDEKLYEREKKEQEKDFIRSINSPIWKAIAEWGRETHLLTEGLQNHAMKLADCLQYNHTITEMDINLGRKIYDIVSEEDRQVLSGGNFSEENTTVNENIEVDVSLLVKMLAWNYAHKVLPETKQQKMTDIVVNPNLLTEKERTEFKKDLNILISKGFHVDA